MDENERLSTENKRIKDELDQGTCAKLDEHNARIAELERSLVNVKHRRDALRAKYEYVSIKPSRKRRQNYRRSQGCSGFTCTPQGGEKILFRRNLQGKCVSAPPRTRSAPPARAGVNF